tara:strand:+ start:394 stop:1185 length:792 start_codon:yes stop_codon:yes gene_type:complete
MSDTQIETPPEKGTPEYNEAMVEKFDKGFRKETDQPQTFEQPKEIEAMPEDGVEKFYNKETGIYDWPNHAKELQYRLDQSKTQTDKPVDGTEKPPQENTVNWEEISKSIAESKSLNEDHVKQLQEFGIPEDIVNSYVDLLGVSQEFAQQRTIEYAGGEDNLNSMFKWATDNLAEEEVKGYNEILDSSNWRMAIDSLRVASGIGAEGSKSNKQNPTLVEGTNQINSSSAFASKEQMIEAMKNPKYKQDPAYRNQVRQKITQSNF